MQLVLAITQIWRVEAHPWPERIPFELSHFCHRLSPFPRVTPRGLRAGVGAGGADVNASAPGPHAGECALILQAGSWSRAATPPRSREGNCEDAGGSVWRFESSCSLASARSPLPPSGFGNCVAYSTRAAGKARHVSEGESARWSRDLQPHSTEPPE